MLAQPQLGEMAEWPPPWQVSHQPYEQFAASAHQGTGTAPKWLGEGVQLPSPSTWLHDVCSRSMSDQWLNAKET